MNENGDFEQTTSSLDTNLPVRVLATMQRNSVDSMTSDIMQDFRTALEILTHVSPLSSNEANETIIAMEEIIGSTFEPSNSYSRRYQPSSTTQALVDRNSDSATGTVEGDSANNEGGEVENDLERTWRRELNRLWSTLQTNNIRRDVATLTSFAPFLVIVLLRSIFDTFLQLIIIILAFFSFHVSNMALVSSVREKRFVRAIQSFMVASLFFAITHYFYGLNTILIPLRFLSYTYDSQPFLASLYIVMLTDFAVKLLTIQLKALVTLIPSHCICIRRRRRIYQFIEYASQLYRYVLPVPQWSTYFNYDIFSIPLMSSDHMFAMTYIGYKVFISNVVMVPLYDSLKCVLRTVAVGERASSSETEQIQQCAICFGELNSAVKLLCTHIFCEECIGTWLDRENNTCPICRAPVPKEDTLWKNGHTTYIPQIC